MTYLKPSDLLGLGFMTFALFLGAGNIIFPPEAGLSAGSSMGIASLGFLITGVGLPLLTVVALGRVGGGMPELTSPLGKVAGITLAVAVYLAIGPLFATPRTAAVSFQIGVEYFTGGSSLALFVYTLLYFCAVVYLSLNPGRLVDRVGKVITPVLIASLLVLGMAAIFVPFGGMGETTPSYREAPFVQGFLQGYLTMDALGAMVFGIVITTAIRDKGITDRGMVTRYAVIAGIIAAVGLSLVYLSLFYLGATSNGLVEPGTSGGHILSSYVQHTFGNWGMLLLSMVIVLACLTTGVGLLTACGEFFSGLLNCSYKLVIIVMALFSLAIANQGLSQLIMVSLPALYVLYPLAIVLVTLSLADRLWHSKPLVFILPMLVALIFSLTDGLVTAGLDNWVPAIFKQLPLASHHLGWLIPTLVAIAVVVVLDQIFGKRKTA